MRPARLERLPWRKIDDLVIIIHPKGGLIHELNASASHLWLAADGSRSTEDLAQELSEEFAIDISLARNDTEEFFSKLASSGLIRDADSL